MKWLRVVVVAFGLPIAAPWLPAAAEEMTPVGSDAPDEQGSGSICMMSHSVAGYEGLKNIVQKNIQLSNGAKVTDVWVTLRVVAVEFEGASGGPVEAMLPVEVAEQNGLRPCPGLAAGVVGSAAALALGGALAGVALSDDDDDDDDRGRRPPGVPPPPPQPPGPPPVVPPPGRPPVSPSR